MAEHERHIGLGSQCGGLVRELSRQPEVVGIEKCDERRCGGRDASITGARRARLGLVQEPHLRAQVLLNAVAGGVGGGVVHHDHVEIEVRGRLALQKDALDGLPDERRGVVGRYDDADGGVHGAAFTRSKAW